MALGTLHLQDYDKNPENRTQLLVPPAKSQDLLPQLLSHRLQDVERDDVPSRAAEPAPGSRAWDSAPEVFVKISR